MIRKKLPFLTLAALIGAWQVAVLLSPEALIPGPWSVVLGIFELLWKGLLLKYVVASLFRVTWGYLLAVVLAIPFGLLLGWYRGAGRAFGPLLQILRPISPLAWIPISILWFGVGDLAAMFLILLASFLPLVVSSMHAVQNVDPTHLRAGRNFGLSETQLLQRVLFPAALPQLIVALRITLGIAWLVVVAAEMIAVNSGLGFLIVDARNAGNRYDLIVGGMVMIGVIGLILDTAIRSLEKLPSLRWGYGESK
jgi:NitT/TauT family transport system permease protein